MQYDPGLIESVMIQISQNLSTLLSIKCTTVLKRIKYHPRISTLFYYPLIVLRITTACSKNVSIGVFCSNSYLKVQFSV